MTLRPSRQFMTGFSLLMALSLAGCATAAQRQAQQSSGSTREAAAQFKACGGAIIAKPEYAALLRHYPEAGQPTMAQLTDETFISPEEATLFAARHDELNPCKTHLLSALATARPDLVPVFADLFSNGVAVSVQLVERKITWGEDARQVQRLSSELRQKVAVADRQWLADLNASHQQEIAQRQAAGAALLQWSAQQQMINAMNRPLAPVQTTCNRMGSLVNCTSY